VTVGGVWVGNRIYWPLELVTIIDWTAVAKLHSLQFTTAYSQLCLHHSSGNILHRQTFCVLELAPSFSAPINEYQKHTNNVFGGVKRGRYVGLTSLPPSVSRLSRKCVSFSEPCGLQWHVTRDSFISLYSFDYQMMGLKKASDSGDWPKVNAEKTKYMLCRQTAECKYSFR
jgi:hypothetical protein